MRDGGTLTSRLPRRRVVAVLGVVLAVAGGSLGAGTATSAAKARPTLLTGDGSNDFQIKPRLIVYTGDGSGYLAGRHSSQNNRDKGQLHWKSWGRHRAHATGWAWLDDCDPSCAEGTFHRHHATVKVDRVRHGHFKRMTIHFRYQGHKITDVRVLRHNGDYWAWAIKSQTGFPGT
jgi:hypothetical protein